MSDFNINAETIVRNTKESMTLSESADKIVNFINEDPDKYYEIAIGADSMTYSNTIFTLAITVHRLHSGGIFFYKRMEHKAVKNLRLKLEEETQISLDTTDVVLTLLKERGLDITTSDKISFAVHVDVGRNGPTKELIQELEGWVTALGYDCEIKPDSYAASYIADKYSK